jgi:hypothetical protein
MAYETVFGSLSSYQKGTIEVNDDLKHYAFSNIFEVAGKSKPFERVAVAKNIEYVAEVIKVDGSGPWYVAPHDEFAVVMDGEVEFNFVKLDPGQAPAGGQGARQLAGQPNGQKMGRVRARRGHQVLLPAGAAYQLASKTPSVAIIQTLAGPATVERWTEICTLS